MSILRNEGLSLELETVEAAIAFLAVDNLISEMKKELELKKQVSGLDTSGAEKELERVLGIKEKVTNYLKTQFVSAHPLSYYPNILNSLVVPSQELNF